MKSVIINADDFGARPETNRAIIRAHTEGVLTSASLMVNETAAGEAVELAGIRPDLAVGLHVVMSDGLSALSHRQIPHIVGENGRFRSSPAAAGLISYFSRAARAEVEREVEAQFARFRSTGIPFSHVDGHQHLHMHPVIWDAVIRACEYHGVRRIRILNEEYRPKSHGGRTVRLLEWLVFRALRRRCIKSLRGRGFTVADRVYGHLETGHMDEAYVIELLGRLGGDTNEIYMHPGTAHAASSVERQSDMDVELGALLSAALREQIDRLGLRLTTYPEIERTPASPVV